MIGTPDYNVKSEKYVEINNTKSFEVVEKYFNKLDKVYKLRLVTEYLTGLLVKGDVDKAEIKYGSVDDKTDEEDIQFKITIEKL